MIYILYTRQVVGSQAQLFPRAEIRIKSHGVKNDSVKDALLLLLAQAIVLSEISLNTRGKFVSNIERKKWIIYFRAILEIKISFRRRCIEVCSLLM